MFAKVKVLASPRDANDAPDCVSSRTHVWPSTEPSRLHWRGSCSGESAALVSTYDEATTAALGDTVETVPGLTVTVTAAAQTDPDPLDGHPLVAAEISYENRSDEDGMLAF